MLGPAVASRAGALTLQAAASAGSLRCRPPPFFKVPQRRRRPAATAAASSDSEGELPLPQQPLAGSNPLLEVENQNERALVYSAISALLGAAGTAVAVAPNRAIEYAWGACPTPLVSGLARQFGVALILAAVCANCLKVGGGSMSLPAVLGAFTVAAGGPAICCRLRRDASPTAHTHTCAQEAAEHDRLGSETYQRLNLALMWWGIGTALTLWLAPQQPLRLALGCAAGRVCVSQRTSASVSQASATAARCRCRHGLTTRSLTQRPSPPPLGPRPDAGWAPRCWLPPLPTRRSLTTKPPRRA